MSQVWRRPRGWEHTRVAAFAIGLAFLLMVAAYAFGGIKSGVTPGGVVAAVAALSIAGIGVLYAFRLGAGGLVD